MHSPMKVPVPSEGRGRGRGKGGRTPNRKAPAAFPQPDWDPAAAAFQQAAMPQPYAFPPAAHTAGIPGPYPMPCPPMPMYPGGLLMCQTGLALWS